MLALRMGKTRIIAETGAGMHGVATATLCAKFGLPCIVYMGSVDVERQKPNVLRMKMLGAEVRAVESGSKTLKDAMNEALRDWVTNVADTFYCIGTVAGPHPYPAMVRDFQCDHRPRDARADAKAEGRLPDSLIACIGGGSNAMGLFHPFLDERAIEIYGVEAAGHGLDSGKHAASIAGGKPGVLHGNRTYLLMNDDGQIEEAHSISAGLDYPGIGPEHAWLNDMGRVKFLSATDDEAVAAFQLCSKLEGIIPALEPAHALARVLDLAPKKPKGSPDGGQYVGARRQGSRFGGGVSGKQEPMTTRIDRRFAALKDEGRAALVTFTMAGDPDYDTSLAIAKALPKAGADVIELGMPFTDPMADGPAIQAAGVRALKRAAHDQDAGAGARVPQSDDATPIVLMGYYNPIYIYGVDRFLVDAKAAGVDGLIVVDLPPEEDEELCLPTLKAGLNFIRLATPTTDDKRLPAVLNNTSGFVYYVSITGITGAAAPDAGKVTAAVARIKRHTKLPVAVGFGVRTAEQARAIAGADGVVVGSALVDALRASLDKNGKAGPGTVKAVTDLVSALADGVRSARRVAASDPFRRS